MYKTCETCVFWAKGEAYATEPYGLTPSTIMWDSSLAERGDCRFYPPGVTQNTFPVTYKFHWCREYQEKRDY